MAEAGERPKAGDTAPAFTLDASSGKKVSLGDFKGRPVVAYFYPKDDTPGCTTEAQGFRDTMPELEQAGAVVLGISPDTVDSHCKFRDKYGLNFELLADPDHKVAEKYGVWVEKNRFGKKSWGIQRATFLIGPDGKVAKVWARVTPDGHAQEVLDAIKSLSPA